MGERWASLHPGDIIGDPSTDPQVPTRSEGVRGTTPRPPAQSPAPGLARHPEVRTEKCREVPLAHRAPPPPHSTLPDSPPDSGSEAYSPPQVTGESVYCPALSGPTLALSEREGGGRPAPTGPHYHCSNTRGAAIVPLRVGSCVESPVPEQCHLPGACAIMDAPFGGKWPACRGHCCWAHLALGRWVGG